MIEHCAVYPDTIAGAVMREIERNIQAENAPFIYLYGAKVLPFRMEGYAYKCQFERMGGCAIIMCSAQIRDEEMMRKLTRSKSKRKYKYVMFYKKS